MKTGTHKITAQTLSEINHNDTNWQIVRLQKEAKLNNVLKFVMNKRFSN